MSEVRLTSEVLYYVIYTKPGLAMGRNNIHSRAYNAARTVAKNEGLSADWCSFSPWVAPIIHFVLSVLIRLVVHVLRYMSLSKETYIFDLK